MNGSAPHHVAIVGGSGAQGRGLGYRFARAGHRVTLGSREAPRAAAVAAEINARLADEGCSATVAGGTNDEAVRAADIVVLAIPYRGHRETVAALPIGHKVVISCVNPVGFDAEGPIGLALEEGRSSAAEQAQQLHPESVVVGAFHHVAAVTLWSDVDFLKSQDVLVVSDSSQAKRLVSGLAMSITGHSAIDGGRLRMARHIEAFTAVLVSVNLAYDTFSGLSVHGVDFGARRW